MKWIGISGGWRKITPEIEDRVREIVREIINRGDGIVSGGALSVDFVATDEALKYDPGAKRIKIFLPTTLERYAPHMRKHASFGEYPIEEAEKLISQLKKIKTINPVALVENPDGNFTEETKKKMYYDRNSMVVDYSDELIAFPIKVESIDSPGTNDTIEKAKRKGIPVKIFAFDLTKKQ